MAPSIEDFERRIGRQLMEGEIVTELHTDDIYDVEVPRVSPNRILLMKGAGENKGSELEIDIHEDRFNRVYTLDEIENERRNYE